MNWIDKTLNIAVVVSAVLFVTVAVIHYKTFAGKAEPVLVDPRAKLEECKEGTIKILLNSFELATGRTIDRASDEHSRLGASMGASLALSIAEPVIRAEIYDQLEAIPIEDALNKCQKMLAVGEEALTELINEGFK